MIYIQPSEAGEAEEAHLDGSDSEQPYQQHSQQHSHQPPVGLWDQREQDACGIGFIADIEGRASHRVLKMALQALERLSHRGAVGADGRTSDGTGVLTQIPWRLLKRRFPHLDADTSDMAVAVLFLPIDEPGSVVSVKSLITEILSRSGLSTLAWAAVPIEPEVLGDDARATLPRIVQVVVERPADVPRGDAFERRLLLARKRLENAARQRVLDDLSVVSFSHRTLVYKSMALARDLADFYPDLSDPDFTTAIALFHQRFSTNTRPTWRLAQPFRMLAHNGEINTIQGNLNWMKTRESQLESELWGEDLAELLPVLDERASDSAMLDQALEMLYLSGRDPLHAIMMLMPEAGARTSAGHDPALQAFYDYHAALIEPWDGPAAVVLTDGRMVAAALDRNGLRPQRFWLTQDGLIILGSEVGIVDLPEGSVVEKGRLGPGEMLAVDTVAGVLLRNDEIKSEIARRKPYGQWLDQHRILPPEIPAQSGVPSADPAVLFRAQQAFGYTKEALEKIVDPMLSFGKPPVGSMGNDAPLSVLSVQPQLLYGYFKQRFAQVTNPPIDPLRERLVFSLDTFAGGWSNLLAEEIPETAHVVRFKFPILTGGQFQWLIQLDDPSLRCLTLDATWAIDTGNEGLRAKVDELAEQAEEAAQSGVSLSVLSDRNVGPERAPVPMLLATSGVHHHLVRRGQRMKVSLICDTAEPREDHHYACLLGFGATLIHPYLALATVRDRSAELGVPEGTALANYLRALEQGLLKSMSRLGVCPMTSYHGAQLFEILGLDEDVVEQYFTGTRSRVGGVGLKTLAEDMLDVHAQAFGQPTPDEFKLQDRGLFRFRKGGEHHELRPKVFKNLHKAVRTGSTEAFAEYSAAVGQAQPARLRDLLAPKRVEQALPLADVEPIEVLVQRFCSAAMSLGALSKEAHEVLAVGMNRLGARSNSGEGGEHEVRFQPYDAETSEQDFFGHWQPSAGDWGNSAIKQVASGRFGVTPEYLRSAREIEIKMAQGSKPGEGGQIPGHKVTSEIAELRHAVAGVPLISPPPHHDIYSIEDLAQLIHDLKRVNPEARIGVKLVSLAGVGTVACGVAKAGADYILISGDDGGTGASPLSSIKHAGMPWEIGLAETQQMLVRSGLRGRVSLRVDGGLKTGRDVLLAALLGAEEFAFGTAPLIAIGCVMARQCHLNTCPVGIATQRPELRTKFPGTPEHVVAFMSFVAEEVRHGLSVMGASRLDDIIGRFDLIEAHEDRAPVKGLFLDRLLVDPDPSGRQPRRRTEERNGRVTARLDERVFSVGASTFNDKLGELQTMTVNGSFHITNQDRSVGARLSGHLASQDRLWRRRDRPLRFDFFGVAGQSFGVFLAEGLDFRLTGEAQDYVGKGLSGGRIVLRDAEQTFHSDEEPAGVQTSGHPASKVQKPRNQVIAGNTLLYGATRGEFFAAGRVGERFCVRNSGASAVVEGCGDHGCEYMTGGVAVILGTVGRNFGAGMSGGQAFVWDPDRRLEALINPEMVELKSLELHDDAILELHALLEQHLELTGSRRADEILAQWPSQADSFVRVVPKSSNVTGLSRDGQENSRNDGPRAVLPV